MFNSYDTLSLLAEIGIAIAGFSGIVIALGGQSLSAVTVLEKRRLTNLFMLSGFVLFMSLTIIALLHLALEHMQWLWRAASAAMFLIITPWLVMDILKILRLEHSEKQHVSWLVFYLFDAIAFAGLFLQVANVFWIRAEWPFILAMVIATAGAFQQFILIVQTKLRAS